MKFKDISPCELLKIATSVSLLLIEKFDEDELNTLKNLMSLICCNLSSCQTQKYINRKE